MGENSKIEWTHHTFNPWIGCTHVSEGCRNCYAETLMDKRYGKAQWGDGKPRVLTSESNWRLPLRWDREAASAGDRRRVFCASLADVFDPEVSDVWRDDLFFLIDSTTNLDWLLLTKRPENALRYLNEEGRDPRSNVWFGTSIEHQQAADTRIPILLQIAAAVRFLSVEPLLGPIEFSNVTRRSGAVLQLGKVALHGIHWVIVGGESGLGARPMHPEWPYELRDQCTAAGVPFFFKQWGEYAPMVLSSSPSVAVDYRGRVTKDMSRDSFPSGASSEDRWAAMYRVGKKNAGRLLDGRTYDEFPVALAAQ